MFSVVFSVFFLGVFEVERVKKSLVFLSFYLNIKEKQIRVQINAVDWLYLDWLQVSPLKKSEDSSNQNSIRERVWMPIRVLANIQIQMEDRCQHLETNERRGNDRI